MLRRSKSKDMKSESMALPGAYMSKEQIANYLTDLRSNRPPRPNGTRPLPNRDGQQRTLTTAASNPNFRPSGAYPPQNSLHWSAQPSVPLAPSNTEADITIHAMSPQRSSSALSRRSLDVAAVDAALIPPQPGSVYIENGQRWMEKQEARSLREALNDMDLKAESRLHAAAQDEASELVLEHLTGRLSGAPYKYKQHLRKGSHARSISQGRASLNPTFLVRPESALSTSARYSVLPASSDLRQLSFSAERGANTTSGTAQGSAQMAVGGNDLPVDDGKCHSLWDSPQKKAYLNLAKQTSSIGSIRSGSKGRVSSRNNAKGLFSNPDDQIYEEPEDDLVRGSDSRNGALPAPLNMKGANQLSNTRSADDFSTTVAASAPTSEKVFRSEIHRNPPSQTRDPAYVINGLPPTPPDSDSDVKEVSASEVRSEDIRQATSKALKDRSAKLPTPAFVTDRPGRPIISFDPQWTPQVMESERSDQHPIPPRNPARDRRPLKLTSTDAPSINIPATPCIAVEPPSSEINHIPSVTVSTPASTARGLPNPKATSNPPRSRYSAASNASLNSGHSQSVRRPTATCTQCQLPISGRVVSAAQQRFHPECFICHNCGEGLECVAFYPEPDVKRGERLDRIRRRARGVPIEDMEKFNEAEDGDERLRFYCHLDFHELFSPRCRSCKTPIEGEVVVACGGEWHVGHFFCAECGDPFDSSTPFVEKDGYAWCVNCHTNRYSTKCKKCRKPVTDTVINALGSEWHAECFNCVECDGEFVDGQFFLQGENEDPVCIKCEQIRLKA